MNAPHPAAATAVARRSRRTGAAPPAACASRDVTAWGTSAGSPSVVELAWALILSAARGVPSHALSMRAGRWDPTAGFDLAGRTLGLVGLGRTGGRMAAIAAAYVIHVTIAWSQNLTNRRAAECGVRRVSKAELFGTADVVSLHVVLSRC